MRFVCLAKVGVPALVLMTGVFAFAQTNPDWQKSYPVTGKASMTIGSGDASTEVRSCGECREVRIRVEWRDRKADDYTINESKSGDRVAFELKEKPHLGVHFSMGMRRWPQVTVDTPSAADLDARTSDGSLRVSGIQGRIELHTSDGAVDVFDVSGALRLISSDGSISIHNVTGTLESRSSDGRVIIEGRFTSVMVHTSDGSLELTLADGSKLTAPSRVESSDGHVTVRLPRTLAVDLDVHTGDGKISCSLPVAMEGYDSSHGSGHNLRGKLNAGGATLSIHTSDGSVSIGAS